MNSAELKTMLDYYFKIIQTDGIDNVSKLNTLIKISLLYKEEAKDLENALKYAYLACMLTYSPRADVCCLLGDIYDDLDNGTWAVKWYENAIGNIPAVTEMIGMPKNIYTTTPMLKLSRKLYDLGEYENALEYADAVLNIEPENEDAKYNKEKIEEKIKNAGTK